MGLSRESCAPHAPQTQAPPPAQTAQASGGMGPAAGPVGTQGPERGWCYRLLQPHRRHPLLDSTLGKAVELGFSKECRTVSSFNGTPGVAGPTYAGPGRHHPVYVFPP